MSNPSNRRRNNYAKVWKRDKGICQYCGDPGESIDHVIPVSYTTRNSLDNMVVACMACNHIAHNQLFRSFDEKREHILNAREKERRKENLRLARGFLNTCIEISCEAPKWCLQYGLCWSAQGFNRATQEPDLTPLPEVQIRVSQDGTTLRIRIDP